MCLLALTCGPYLVFSCIRCFVLFRTLSFLTELSVEDGCGSEIEVEMEAVTSLPVVLLLQLEKKIVLFSHNYRDYKTVLYV